MGNDTKLVLNFMFDSLLTFKDLLEASPDAFAFSGVRFKRDFGPYKAGDTVELLWFNLDSGTVAEYKDSTAKSSNPAPVREFPFRLEA